MNIRENEVLELKGGDKVTLRNGDVLVYDEYYGKITNIEDSRVNYDADLKHTSRPELDVIKVERPTNFATVYERNCSCGETSNKVDLIVETLEKLIRDLK